jgi:ribosomal protein S2
MNKFYGKKEKKIKNKLTGQNNKLLTGFFKTKSHHGTRQKDLHIKNTPYIYGIRSKQTLINLNLTVQSVKRVFLLIGKVLQNRVSWQPKQKILIVCNDSNTKMFKKKFELTPYRNQIVYIHEDWVGGFITNPFLLKTRLRNVSLIIGLNETHDNLLIHAAKIYRIPFISLIGTHMNSNLITYPILINTTHIKSTFLFVFLLIKYINNLNL